MAEPVGGVAEVVPVVDVLDVLDAEAAVARDVEPVAGELVRAVVPLHDRLRGAERLASQSHLQRIIFYFLRYVLCAIKGRWLIEMQMGLREISQCPEKAPTTY